MNLVPPEATMPAEAAAAGERWNDEIDRLERARDYHRLAATTPRDAVPSRSNFRPSCGCPGHDTSFSAAARTGDVR